MQRENALKIIADKTYRRGEAAMAPYTSTIQPLLPEVDSMERRGVDLIALASALERGLDPKLVGEVLQYRTWSIDEFNLFNRSTVSTSTMNTAMRSFLDHPRNW